MQPIITPSRQIILAGMSFYGDPFDTRAGWDEDNHIGRLWKRFGRCLEQHGGSLPFMSNPGCAYEVHLVGDESAEKGCFEVFVGMEVTEVSGIPLELLVKILPPTQYAVFSLRGEQIRSDWEKLFAGWLQGSGWRSTLPYNYQYYDERFKGMDRLDESELDVYLPVQKDA